jgi:plasmid stabilization system protein ParE
MAVVVWTVGAKADLTRHYDALVVDAPEAAVQAAQSIVKAGDSLQQSPHEKKRQRSVPLQKRSPVSTIKR